jgi:phosphate transport system permease protein
MYTLSSEGFHTNEAYATAVVLLIIVLVINTLSASIAKKVAKG